MCGEGKAIAHIEIGIAALPGYVVTILYAGTVIGAAIVDRVRPCIAGYKEQSVGGLLL